MDGVKSEMLNSNKYKRCLLSLEIYTFNYFVSWDEWVPETRVLKFNEAGQQKRKELLKAHA